MGFFVAGLNYRTASTEVLERAAGGAADLPQVLLRLQRRLGECVLLSTCNRTEIYATGDAPGMTTFRLLECLGDLAGLETAELAETAYLYSGDDAIRHAFRVTCGLDSMVVGEHQIGGQVQAALQAAGEAGAVAGHLSRLFHRALRVSRRVRSRTGIGHNRLTISSIGVQLVEREIGGLAGREVLLIGVGETGKLAARTLRRMGAGHLTVAGRSPERTARIAAELGGGWVALDALAGAIAAADVVISCTASADPVVTADIVRRARAGDTGGNGAPLIMLDLAMPRDIEPAVAGIPGVTLYGLSDLQAIAEEHRTARAGAAGEAEALLDAEIPLFKESLLELGSEPVIRALGARAESIRTREMERGLRRMKKLDPEQAQVIDALTRSMVAKILADPISYLRPRDSTAAATPIPRLS